MFSLENVFSTTKKSTQANRFVNWSLMRKTNIKKILIYRRITILNFIRKKKKLCFGSISKDIEGKRADSRDSEFLGVQWKSQKFWKYRIRLFPFDYCAIINEMNIEKRWIETYFSFFSLFLTLTQLDTKLITKKNKNKFD